MRFGNVFKFASKKQVVIFCLLMLLSGLIWIGCSPFIGVYHMLVNDYFNFAKSMLDGAVLHKDILDHKGLYTFVPYLIIASIQRDGFTAYSILTVICGMVYFLIWWKYMSIFDMPFKHKCIYVCSCLFLLFLLEDFIVPIPAFTPDNLILCLLPLFFWYIYSDRYLKVSYTEWLMFGFLFGVVLWAKYVLLIFFFPFYVLIVQNVFLHKEWKKLLISHIYGVIGLLLSSGPVWIYCYSNNCFDEMIANYFGMITASENLPLQLILGICMGVIVLFAILSIFVNTIDVKMVFLFGAVCFSCVCASTSFFMNYTMVVLISLIPIYGVHIVKTGKNRFYLLVLLCLFAGCIYINALADTDYIEHPYSIRTIAKENDIQNEEIMYMSEDLGLGSWSNAGTYYHQWIPSRVIALPQGYDMVTYQIDKINNREPKYVVTFALCYYEFYMPAIFEDNGYECIAIWRPHYGYANIDNVATTRTYWYLYKRQD